MIETPRLVLRPWREADRPAFAEINGHPEVGAWLGGVLDRAASDAVLDRAQTHIETHGYGLWAVERRADARLVGAIGLTIMGEDLPAPGALELAWRLHPHAQGQGLATEGAAAARDWAFGTLGASEVVAITAASNPRSQAVMRRLGLAHDPARDFDHPRLAADHPLRRHVFWSLARPGV
ncbi:MAG: GNAT family N-acetyltransferase [Caulobacterales bacterium]|nr:GNAT family N-acetyltransferase [Caulobacterales bacterium]